MKHCSYFCQVTDRTLGLPSKLGIDSCLIRSIWESDKEFPIHTLLPKSVPKESQLPYSLMTSLSHLEILALSSNSGFVLSCFLFLGSPKVSSNVLPGMINGINHEDRKSV